jgi:Two component regulator propeller
MPYFACQTRLFRANTKMPSGTTHKSFIHPRLIPFVWLAFILFLPLISKAERLPIKTYTVADGLLRDNVYKIKQDSRGFLWFCTVDGISRFDGYAFTNFTTSDGLPERHVNDLMETKNGIIWISTNDDLVKFNLGVS